MAYLLMSLRQVPEDEVAEIRQWLDAENFDWYETPAGRWGISAGGLWLRDASQRSMAQARLARYQAERATKARAAWAEARREGRAPSIASNWREDPLRVVLSLAGIALMLGLVALPVWLLWR